MKTIELKLTKLDQLLRVDDPTVFPAIGLNEDAANFIFNEADLFKIKEALKLIIYLPQKEISDNTLGLVKQISSQYFAYQAQVSKQAKHMNFVRGRRNLMVAILFITFCMLIYLTITSLFELSEAASTIVSGVFAIASWVSIWIPLQAFLYDWWPIGRNEKVYQKLSKIDIEILNKS